jgi:hypothetical protein
MSTEGTSADAPGALPLEELIGSHQKLNRDRGVSKLITTLQGLHPFSRAICRRVVCSGVRVSQCGVPIFLHHNFAYRCCSRAAQLAAFLLSGDQWLVARVPSFATVLPLDASAEALRSPTRLTKESMSVRGFS